MSDLTSKYGTPQQILITNYKLTNSIIVFPESKIIYANAQIINYSDIISSEIKEESYTFKTGNTKIVTKNSNGSTMGRAIVGGMIAGPAGAIIGGTTSKKTSEVIDTTRQHTIKHYYVLINLTDIKNPLLKIDCGQNDPKYSELLHSTIQSILASKQEKQDTASKSIADDLIKLASLNDQGIITQEEFDIQKQKLLS